MGPIFSEFDNREKEIMILIGQIESLESDLTGMSDKTIFINILKSTLYVMTYNLIEGIMNLSFDEVYNTLKKENFLNLTPDFQKIVGSNFCSKIENSRKTIIDQVINKIIASGDIKKDINCIGYDRLKDMQHGKFLWGNIDNDTIKEVLIMHSIPIPSQTRFAKSEYLQQIKKNRNVLTHGENSFENMTKTKTISDIKNEIIPSINFIRLIIKEIQGFLDNRKYAKPEKYCITVTYHDNGDSYCIVSNDHNEGIYITSTKQDDIKNIIDLKIENFKQEGLLKDGESFYIYLDENFNLIS